MRILALEPYYGGSHRAFLDGWAAQSRHEFTILGLPDYKWKWRMRHAAITFAEMVAKRYATGERWDAVFCSDMLNLIEFRGLVSPEIAALPATVYFHENQLTYPQRKTRNHDLHFAYTNITTAFSANSVWFNSDFHRATFLSAAHEFLKRMPDHQHLNMPTEIEAKSSVHPPGITPFPARGLRRAGPLRILSSARWEHDKNPQDFFSALELLQTSEFDFRLSVIGESFGEIPEVFNSAKIRFSERIDRWGYQPSRQEYEAALLDADVIVSTADHEFFGIGVVEAVAAGAYPVVPRRLAYPETIGKIDPQGTEGFFYENSVQSLAARLQKLATRLKNEPLWNGDPKRGRRAMERFYWEHVATQLDTAIEKIEIRRHR